MAPLLALAPHAGRYVHWGVVQISLANLLIVVIMLLVFALAVLVPFPHHDEPQDGRPTL